MAEDAGAGEAEVSGRPAIDEVARDVSLGARWRAEAGSAVVALLAPRTTAEPLERGWALPVVLVWAAGRGVNLLLLFAAYAVSKLAGWPFGPDGAPQTTFLNFLSGWDAARYGTIAGQGYPVQLPIDGAGHVAPNNWAFLPVFPFLERVLAQATGVTGELAGVLISVGASCAATIVLYALLRHVASSRSSWWAVVLFSLGPLSFVFVLGYAESLFLFFVFSALLLAVRRRYLLIAPFGVLAAFTRPGALALALALLLVLAARLVFRSRDRITANEIAGLAVSGIATAVAATMWPLIAAAVTGQPGAYVQTEMAWWVPYLGGGELVPLVPGLVMGWVWLGLTGVLLCLALVAGALWWILSRPVRALGLEIVAFALGYVLFLFAVFLPTQSIARLVLPLAPLLSDERLSSSRRRRVWGVSVSLVLQAAAVYLIWTIANP